MIQLVSAGNEEEAAEQSSDGAKKETAGATVAVEAGPAQGVVSADGLNEGQREAVHRWAFQQLT